MTRNAAVLTLLLATGATSCQRESEPPVVPHVVTMKPFRELNFEDGDWVAYVFNDVDVHAHERLNGLPPSKCLVLRDRAALSAGLRDLAFGPPSGADMATVTSSLLLVRDGLVVYETGIVVDGPGPDGLQSQAYGWVPAVPRGALIDFVKRFEAMPQPEVLSRTPKGRTGMPCLAGSDAR